MWVKRFYKYYYKTETQSEIPPNVHSDLSLITDRISIELANVLILFFNLLSMTGYQKNSDLIPDPSLKVLIFACLTKSFHLALLFEKHRFIDLDFTQKA